jgi:hypothetical protein
VLKVLVRYVCSDNLEILDAVMFTSGLTTVLGGLTSWGLGFVFCILTAKLYGSYYYPSDPDPVYFDIAIAGLGAWLFVGVTGTVLVVGLYFRNQSRYFQQ